MEASEKQKNTQEKLERRISLIFLGFLLIGIGDTAYLTASHFQGHIPTCNILEGCNRVLGSTYSEIFGIPLALLGFLYYTFLFIGIIMYLLNGHREILKAASVLSILGFLISIFLLYIQGFVIGMFCQYCILSAITSTFLFFNGMFFLYKQKGLDE